MRMMSLLIMYNSHT
jgi:hypothetical protein